ncbi:sensor histidine kinase [[Clostridium] polysaccharolyticum]|uniref:histidine kinase n=1 Tax=[Clostridium] polysaccharolyticum TaxID=29364 RepID=A0A1H9ZFY7_9FIRM|nr:HAMP domain-containing sensor histidine kinase [[Clostridium] polysaccharolyticum]SES79980.1 Signal transduction histidine kinase [[Clostridium] polysaccharolyticum]
MTGKKKSFRMELLVILICSFILAALTEAVIMGGIYALAKLAMQEQKDSVTAEAVKDPIAFTSSLEYQDRKMPDIKSDFILGFIALAVLLGAVLVILYFMLLTRKFSRDLMDITAGIQEISLGNFEYKIPIRNDSEFGAVAEKLNEMSDSVYLFLCDEQQNEDVKNELITSVAHDIRTPLTSIIGYLYLIVFRTDLQPEIKERYLKIAYDKSKRLEQLTEDLFSYTKYSTDEVKMHYEKIDLVKFMEQMADEFYPSFKEAQLEYDFQCEVPEAIIWADGNTLARAIGNLVSNAIKYGRDGKYINITLKQEGAYAVVSVLNYGAVIPKEALKHIFERFYRVENSRAETTGGSGLGLAIAKRIVELHNGTIEARSDLEGTVFEVKLRLCESEEDKADE